MDEQSRELGLNNPRRRAQEERARRLASEATANAAGAVSGNGTARSSAPNAADGASASQVSRGVRREEVAPAALGGSGAIAAESAGAARGANGARAARGAGTDDSVAASAAEAGPGVASRTGRARTARPAARPAPKKQSWWTRGRIVAVSTVAFVVAVLAALAVGFSWLRWFSADDAADLQGTWYLSGTATPIVITEDRIQLTDDVSYHYTVDTADKTIQFTFGNLTGGGCYRFSLDRGQLALIDGSFTGSDTLNADLGWTIQALWENLQGKVLPPAEKAGKGVTLLSRTPAAGAAPATSAESSDATADIRRGDGGEEVIQDDVVGDLTERFPADIGDPRDKAADEGAGDAASGTTPQDAGGSAEGGSSGASPDAAGAGGAAQGSSGSDAPSAPDAVR